MRKLLFVYSGLLLLGLSCKKESSQTGQVSILKTKWTLSSIQDTKSNVITNFPNDANNKIYIDFTDSLSIISFGGVCIGGQGKYTLSSDNKTIKITDLVTTLIACKYVEWEQYVTSNLANAFTYKINGNNLEIDSNGSYNLNFTKN